MHTYNIDSGDVNKTNPLTESFCSSLLIVDLSLGLNRILVVLEKRSIAAKKLFNDTFFRFVAQNMMIVSACAEITQTINVDVLTGTYDKAQFIKLTDLFV